MNEPQPHSEHAPPQQPAVVSRRRFLGASGKKALYLTPVVLTLTAQEAAASGARCGSGYVHTIGSPCATEGEGKQCCPTDFDGNPLECREGTCQIKVTPGPVSVDPLKMTPLGAPLAPVRPPL